MNALILAASRLSAVVVVAMLTTIGTPAVAVAENMVVPDPCVKTGHISVGNPLAGEYYVRQDGEAAVYVDCPES